MYIVFTHILYINKLLCITDSVLIAAVCSQYLSKSVDNQRITNYDKKKESEKSENNNNCNSLTGNELLSSDHKTQGTVEAKQQGTLQ